MTEPAAGAGGGGAAGAGGGGAAGAGGGPVRAPEGVLDSDGMWEVTTGLPEQVAEAARVAGNVDGLPSASGVNSVVALGMGGSGIGGDVLAAVAAPTLHVPVVVVKDYSCPAFVGPDCLVFAASYSGNTEETLEAVAQAVARGARIVAVTNGGRLAELARSWEAPVVRLPEVPWPRAAFGALAVSPLVVLERMGLLPGASSWVDAAVAQLEARRPTLLGDAGEGARLARRLARTIPLIHGGSLLGAAAALRWKCQINENTKCPAWLATQPELCHNEITGWGQHGDATRQLLSLVMLRHDYEHLQVGRRFKLVAEIMDEVVAGIVEVHAAGEGPLAQLLDLAYIGDVVSLYLAAREGLDPGPIPVLMDLKEALAGPG